MLFAIIHSAGKHINITMGTIPKTNGNKLIIIKRNFFKGKLTSATAANDFKIKPMLTLALLG